ncbi:MAG: pseudaminic acid cytidylyltransferase [Parvibaculum sp.]
MITAIIPARGGSKRIPSKNIRAFAGKPIIGWSIEAAKASGIFDRIIVSTDDGKIADVARQFGADVPFVRPAALSDDQTGTLPVIYHAAKWLSEQGISVDLVCCIYATAPFVEPQALAQGLKAMKETGADFALAVTSFPFPIQRALRITAAGRLEPIDRQTILARSQDLEETWHDAGQFFWSKPNVLLDDLASLLQRAVPLRLPRHLVQDIDTEEDWTRAELMFRAMRLD